jgi:hypothetical protein
MRPTDALREAIRARLLPGEPEAEAVRVASTVVDRGGESVLAVIFFGSRRTQARPNRWSGYDLFVLTRDDYRELYRSLAAAGATKRSPGLLALLNKILPPNQVSLRAGSDDLAPLAKCAVVSLSTLTRETSERRKDHFCAGRLFQPTSVLYARDGATSAAVLQALASAHAITLSWVRPWLPPSFDVEIYCRTLLRVSLSHEIRPEPEGRADALFEAQRPYLIDVYATLLEDLAASGDLERCGEHEYRLAREVTRGERLRTALYFRRSMLRATVRWFKYTVTFDDWLAYIVRKAERHSGRTIVLGPWERRLPIVFLWPRLIRYLRHKNGSAE